MLAMFSTEGLNDNFIVRVLENQSKKYTKKVGGVSRAIARQRWSVATTPEGRDTIEYF